MNIVEQTIRDIKLSDKTQLEICNQAGVSIRWMQNLVHGKMTDPGILKMMRVRDVLMERDK